VVRPGDRPDFEAIFGFVSANHERYPVSVMCRLLQVSSSGFHAWRDRPMSNRARKDVQLSALIRAIYEYSHRTYGAPRIHIELRETYGVRVGCKRVERLMRRAGLQGVQKRRFRCTTRSGAPERFAPDLVQRHFTAQRPNALWLADVTYVPTAEGFLYLAAVLDVFSRYVVGWAMEAHLGSRLVLAALQMAYAQRCPQDVVHHSDHGSEYTAIAFSGRCRELGVRLSMGSVGDCFDNAMMESFFSSLEAEVLDRNQFQTREEARTAIFSWLEGWYNASRRHSGIGYLSPRVFEQRFRAKSAGASAALLPHSRETALREDA
jgi:putative transposase